MAKIYTSGAWVSIPYHKYGTDTDVITSLPTNIIGDGTNATAVIKGNMVQTGTPTPTVPIYPSECGEMSVNLTNVNSFTNSEVTDTGREYFRAQLRLSDSTNTSISIYSNGHYKLSIENVGNTTVTFRHSGETTNILIFSYTATFSTPQTLTVSFDVEGYDPENLNGLVLSKIMLNIGSDELPYAPYDQYIIPILSGGVTTNYALGSVQSTRGIKKLVLDGTEDWSRNTTAISGISLFVLSITDALANVAPVCSHYLGSDTNIWREIPTNGITVSIISNNVQRMVVNMGNVYTETEDFKTYLAQQYANGTPVTVWYVLASETTTTLNEPIRKIGDYADSVSVTGIPTTGTPEQFDVGTVLKPSEVQLTYHGWHSKTDKEYINGSWS